MGESLQETSDALDSFCALIQGDIYRVLDHCEALLQEAVSGLKGLDDDAARSAVVAVNSARDGVANARYGYLNDYLNLSHQLIHDLRET